MRKAGRETHAQLKVCGRILISRPGSTTVCLPWLKPETALLLISCLLMGILYRKWLKKEEVQNASDELCSATAYARLLEILVRFCSLSHCSSTVLFTISLLIYGSVHYLTAPLRFCSLSHCSSTVLFTISLLIYGLFTISLHLYGSVHCSTVLFIISLLLYGSVHYLTAPLRFCSLSHCSSTVLFTISLLIYGSVHYLTAPLRFCSLSHCSSTVLFTISLLIYGSVHYLTAPLRFCSLSHCSSTVLFTISLLLYGSVHYLTAPLRFCSLSHCSSTVLFISACSSHMLPCARPICSVFDYSMLHVAYYHVLGPYVSVLECSILSLGCFLVCDHHRTLPWLIPCAALVAGI